MSALEAVDAESEAVRTPGAFRVTLDYMKSRVESSENIERGVLNIAIIRLDNGFVLVGKSAPADPANYNAAYGRQLAYDDALRQAWPLFAFSHLEQPPAGQE
jgi:hypothetical protein